MPSVEHAGVRRRSQTVSEAHLFAIGIVLAWLAGVRVYLTVFGIGIAGRFGWLDLPPALTVAQSPWVMGVSGVLALVEVFDRQSVVVGKGVSVRVILGGRRYIKKKK